jgi:hypothetical protein
MIMKHLLLVFLLVLSGPAYALSGTSPSVDIPVTITQSVVGGLPAPAQAAGFTTHALNTDFSQPAYSNIANWVDGCGGPTSGNHWVYSYYGFQQGAPCADLIMETDASIGKQVLHWQVHPGDPVYAGDTSSTAALCLCWPDHCFQGSATNWLGPQMYMEINFRISAASFSQNTNITGTIAGGDLAATSQPGNWLEPDFAEIYANNNDGTGWIYGDGTIEWVNYQISNGLFTSPPANLRLDMTAYHTLGVLFTSNTTDFAKCYYVDGKKIGCWSFTLTNPSDLTVLHQIFVWSNGAINQANNTDTYIQSINIWMCANWATQTCVGTLVTQ